MRMLVLPSGRIVSKGYSIQDIQGRKMIMVDKESKTARILEGFLPPCPSVVNLNLYELIKNIRKDAVERLPDEEIDGRKTMVFRVEMKELPNCAKTNVESLGRS